MPINVARKTIHICSVLSLIACVAFSVYAINRQLFTSQEALQAYIAGFGAMGALVFIAFQVVQVVIPILPGGISCLAGVLLFGSWAGFLYNYIGICAGSFVVIFTLFTFTSYPAAFRTTVTLETAPARAF